GARWQQVEEQGRPHPRDEGRRHVPGVGRRRCLPRGTPRRRLDAHRGDESATRRQRGVAPGGARGLRHRVVRDQGADERGAASRTPRRGEEGVAVDDINGLVATALRTGDWSPVLVAIDSLYAEKSGSIRGITRHLDGVTAALERVEPQDNIEAQAARLADWLVMSTEQAAVRTEARGLSLVWRTEDDEHVRAEHRAADGQRVQPGEPFTVGGVQMFY